MSATTSAGSEGGGERVTSAASATCAEASIAAKVSRVIVAGCATARADVLREGCGAGDRASAGIVASSVSSSIARPSSAIVARRLAFVSSFM